MPNVTGFRLRGNKDGTYDIVSVKSESKSVPSPTGSNLRAVFKRVFDNGHNARYEKVKEIDMYERIQSYAKSCDIVTLMARYANGDVEAINQRQGIYGDFSGLSDIRDSYAAYANMKGVFDSLGEEQKAQFGNSFESFLHDLAVRAFTPQDQPQGMNESKSEEVTSNES